MAKSSFALLALTAATAHCASLNNQVNNQANYNQGTVAATAHSVNPIRKVVTLLQNLKTQVEGEGEKEREMHEKYMCYCKNGAASLQKSIDDAGVAYPQLESEIKEAEAKKDGLDGEIAKHKADQVAAHTAMAEATALRDKEAEQFGHDMADHQAELNPINQALTALGMLPGVTPPGEEAGEESGAEPGANATGAANATSAEGAATAATTAFIQSSAAQVLKKVIQAKPDMNEGDRSELMSFLSAGSTFPGAAEIMGIIRQMKEDVVKDIDELNTTELASIKSYEGLMVANEKALAPIQAMVEEKLMRAGEIPVAIVQMKNDLGDTGEKMVQDKKFLSDLDGNCAAKEKFYGENVKNRGQELQALAETIKVLNDEDALELFKKTLPGASSAFFQISESTKAVRNRALSALKSVKNHDVGVDFIMLTLNGSKAGFDKVVKLINDLTADLKREGAEDLAKKEYCARKLDQSDDKKKLLENEVADHEATLDDLESVPAQLKEDIDALEDGIRDLDKSVAEATAQRKEEAADYTPLMANDAAAKELILFAKNKLNKFYNPKLHKANVRELSDEDRATLAAGGTLAPLPEAGGIAGTGITGVGFAQRLPPPPQAVGAYNKKSQESTGVIAMMDLIVKDLDREMHEASATEKSAQKDYENVMSDASAKRRKDSQSLTDKQGALADTNARLLEVKDAKGNTARDLMGVEQYISNLHAECDWLVKYFDMRLEARNGEIDALFKAKAVLKGADYSFLQAKTLLNKK